MFNVAEKFKWLNSLSEEGLAKQLSCEKDAHVLHSYRNHESILVRHSVASNSNVFPRTLTAMLITEKDAYTLAAIIGNPKAEQFTKSSAIEKLERLRKSA